MGHNSRLCNNDHDQFTRQPTVVAVTLSLEDTTQHSNLCTSCSHASWQPSCYRRERNILWKSWQEVYMYSPPINSWIYINDLPVLRSCTAVAVLSLTEILVIGGWGDGGKVDTVYKGTLHLNLWMLLFFSKKTVYCNVCIYYCWPVGCKDEKQYRMCNCCVANLK